MTEEAAHLVDAVLPIVPYRQWVFTFPFWLRYVMAWNISLRDAILRIAVDCTRQFYLRRLALRDPKLATRAKVGGLSVEHRFDSALKIDVHWHLLLSDGVFVRTRARKDLPARVKFIRADALRPHDVPEVLAHVEARVMKLLKRRRLIAETPDGQPPPDEFARKNPAMAAIIQASLFDKSVLDPASPPVAEDLEATAVRAGAAAEPRPKAACEHNQPAAGFARIFRYRAPLNRFAVCGSKYSPPGCLLARRHDAHPDGGRGVCAAAAGLDSSTAQEAVSLSGRVCGQREVAARGGAAAEAAQGQEESAGRRGRMRARGAPAGGG